MQYRLHDVDKGLWAWVKAQAYMEELTINQYIMALLIISKDKQEQGHSISHIIDALRHSLIEL